MKGARLALGLVLVALPSIVSAKTVDVELQAFPGTFAFSYGGETRRGVVVVRNVSKEPLHDLRLSALAESGLEVTLTPSELKQLAPQSEYGWSISVNAAAVTALADSLQLRLDYAMGAPPARSQRLAFAALPLKPSDVGAVENLADVQIKTTTEPLSDRRPVNVHLVIRNKSPFVIHIGKVATRSPEFITATPVPGANRLEPREMRTVSFAVKTEGRVVPGKHLVVFEVELNWTAHGQPFRRHFVESQEVNVAVFGESEIVKVLGVPSFLLLPGFLCLVTFRLLLSWQLLGMKDQSERSVLKVEKPEFWVVAITLSGAMALIYPLRAGYSYLDGYTLQDIAFVWLLSVGASALTWLVGAVGWRGWRLYRDRQRVPTETDTPLTVLEKIHRQGLGLQLERVKFPLNGKELSAFVLQRRDQAGESVWVGPGIVVNWKASPDPALETAIDDAVRQDRVASLLGQIRKGIEQINLVYKTGDVPPRPTSRKQSELTPLDPPGLLVEVQRS